MTGQRGTRTSAPSNPGPGYKIDAAESGAPDDEGARSTPPDDDADDQDLDDKSTHPDDDSSHSPFGDLNEEDAQELERILAENARLRKGKAHADKKIGELGRDNARYRNKSSSDDDEGITARMDRLEDVILRLAGSNGNGNDADDQDGDDFEDAFNAYFNQDGDDGGNSKSKNTELENVLTGMYGTIRGMEKRFDDYETSRAAQTSLSRIQEGLGVTAEAAEALLEIAGPDVDVVGLVKAAELTSLSREARQTARSDRQARRASIGHPTAGTRQTISQGDGDSMKAEAEAIAEMKDGKAKRDRLFKFFDDYPEGANLMRSVLGYGNLDIEV